MSNRYDIWDYSNLFSIINNVVKSFDFSLYYNSTIASFSNF